MANYAIGDIQGCYHALQGLLQRIQFDTDHDRLYLLGDLVNRGNGSLAVLRWAVEHKTSVVSVLGNHDLHALAMAEGLARAHRGDTLEALLAAEDAPQLLGWLRQQRLVHVVDGDLLVHAGLLPEWTAAQAVSLAAEVEQVLHAPDYRDFLAQMYGNQPDRWDGSLRGMDRLRLIVNAMTRLRVCKPDGSIDFRFKGELQDLPVACAPWFDMPGRQSRDTTIVFGHWSALGLLQRDDVQALDTGCLWGGRLTALRLQDRQVFQVPSDPRDGVMAVGD